MVNYKNAPHVFLPPYIFVVSPSWSPLKRARKRIGKIAFRPNQVKSMMLTDAGSDEPLCPYHS